MARGKKTGGRKAGTPNKSKTDIAATCRALVEDADYLAAFTRRLREGTLPPPLEAMAWHYAHGKPIERLTVSGEDGGPIEHSVTFRVVRSKPELHAGH